MIKQLVVNIRGDSGVTKWALPQVFNHAAIQLTTDDKLSNNLQVGDKIQITATVCEGKIEIDIMTNEDIE